MNKINNKYKKRFNGALLVVVVFGLATLFPMFFTQAFAEDVSISENNQKIMAEESTETKAVLSDRISEAKYLYNFDGAPDYIYVEFEEGGYAIFANGTNEILEYSPCRNIVADYDEAIIYGGPVAYYTHTNNIFTDINTNAQVIIGKEDINNLSIKAREVFKIQNQTSDIDLNNSNLIENVIENEAHKQNVSVPNSAPALDEDNFISPTAGATYIEHSDYFFADPTHGVNNGKSCTTVATQLLLSYYNYYYDRRIIPDIYLNGTQTLNPQWNPNFCTDPMDITSFTSGSNQDFHDNLFDRGISNMLRNAKNPLKNYLEERNVSHNIKCIDKNPYLVSSTPIIEELNANRPVVMATGPTLNGTNDFGHAVIAYGYQNLAPYDDGISYLGYVTHLGWSADENQIWLNSIGLTLFIQ